MLLLLILFLKINAFYLDSYYWNSFSDNNIYIYDAFPIENAYGLKDDIDYEVYFNFNNLDPDFTCPGNCPSNIPMWVVLVIHAFENWRNIEGTTIDFKYNYIPSADESSCFLDDFNSICWSSPIEPNNTYYYKFEDPPNNTKNYKNRLITLNKNYDLGIDDENVKFCHIKDDIFENKPNQAFCYDFLSFMNRAVGEFLGFRTTHSLESVLYYQIPQNTKTSLSTPYRTLYTVDEDAAKCLYPNQETGIRFKNEACCSSSKNYLRPPDLCDTRLSSDSKYTLGVEDSGGTCSVIKDNNKDNNGNLKYYFLYSIFILILLLIRLVFRKKLILLLVFFCSFNLYSSFEYDLGFDDIDYKAIKESLKIEDSKEEEKQFINTKDILEQEKIKKQELEQKYKSVELKKVETLVQNLDDQLKYKQFRELKPFFANINFGLTYSTVSDFKKINQDYKNAGFRGFNDFNLTYLTILEFGIENLLFKNFNPFLAIAYQFNTDDTGIGQLYDGNELIDTEFSNSFYAIPIKIGAKYSFYNTESIKSGFSISGGIWIAESSISLINSNTISKLNMSGTGYTSNALFYMDFLVVSNVFFSFNLGYEYSKCDKVLISNSSGDFEAHFPKKTTLLIHDGASETSRAFRYYISGIHVGAGIKGIF